MSYFMVKRSRHSLRAGDATTAANAGVNDRCWKRHGRWKSENSKVDILVTLLKEGYKLPNLCIYKVFSMHLPARSFCDSKLLVWYCIDEF